MKRPLPRTLTTSSRFGIYEVLEISRPDAKTRPRVKRSCASSRESEKTFATTASRRSPFACIILRSVFESASAGGSESESETSVCLTVRSSEIIKSAMPAKARDGGHHPAKRTFQAIRIEVNSELAVIEPALRDAVKLLNPGGRMAVITFHSLEDRITKQTMASLASGCTCPRDFPVCVCGKKPIVRVISNKPIVASHAELDDNPRSRSAKLRVAEKI